MMCLCVRSAGYRATCCRVPNNPIKKNSRNGTIGRGQRPKRFSTQRKFLKFKHFQIGHGCRSISCQLYCTRNSGTKLLINFHTDQIKLNLDTNRARFYCRDIFVDNLIIRIGNSSIVLYRNEANVMPAENVLIVTEVQLI